MAWLAGAPDFKQYQVSLSSLGEGCVGGMP